MSNINSISSENCYGCSSCYSVCPHMAIEMRLNVHGFFQPHINPEKCTNCFLCTKVCPTGKEDNQKSKYSQCYGIKNIDVEQRKKSTSGGAFSLFAKNVVNHGGIVFGATFLDKKVQHIGSQDINLFLGSKYVQSELNDSYKKVASNLKNSIYVMFVGTPCQCAGLKEYLNSLNVSTENLLLVDFICHGTPSPLLFKEYVKYVENHQHKDLKTHFFRTKYNGWKSHVEENIFADGTKDHDSYSSQLFKIIFYSHLGMKEKCFDCKFASQNRVGDVTLGDFWGIEKSHQDFFDNDGVSFVMINTSKGQDAFEKVKSDCEYISVSIQDTEQPLLMQPVAKPSLYDRFWDDYNKKGFNYVVKKYFHGGILRRMLSVVYHKLAK